MLVLSRRAGQSVLIGPDIEVFVLATDGPQVRIGVNAPRALRILRRELVIQIERENQLAAENRHLTHEAVYTLVEGIGRRGEADIEPHQS